MSVDEQYQNWIETNLPWLSENSTKIDEVRIYASDGILTAIDDQEIQKHPGSEREKYALLYRKVKAAGFSQIDTIIRALHDTNQQGIAQEFETFKLSVAVVEDSAGVDFSYNEKPLIVKVVKGKKYMDLGNSYRMRSKPRGQVLIICNERYNNPDMNRPGANNDLHYMLNLFEQFNYKTYVAQNVPSYQLSEKLEKFQTEFTTTSVDSCIVVCMGHGEINKFVMVDDVHVNIWDDIIFKFNDKDCPQLKGKPKIFIIQACQIYSDDTRTATDSRPFVQHQPTDLSDILVCFPTLPGTPANRDVLLGTWYLYCLTYIFMNNAHNKDIRELLKMTNDKMANIQSDGIGSQRSFTTDIGFYKQFYFNPGYDE